MITRTRSRLFSLATWIYLIVIVHLVIGLFVHLRWMTASDDWVLRIYFDYEGVLVFMFMSAVQLVCAIFAYRSFTADEALGTAWFYIMWSSVAGFVGTILKQVFAVNTALNPVAADMFGGSHDARALFGNVGTVIGGPIQLILLGAGLYLALRVYRQLGLRALLKTVDFVLLGATFLYSVAVLIGIVSAIRNSPITVERALTWPGDYLLSVLLLEAVFLRRFAAEMGNGYVCKVWSAFAAGVFIFSFCSFMNWLTAYGFMTWEETSFVWYLWYPASAAFALGPAYQTLAIRTAERRLLQELDGLEGSRS